MGSTPSMVCDSHVHVFDPVRFPYATPRRFTPGAATAEALKQHLRHCGVARAVIVQPSVYGTRNACLLDALQQLDGASKGIAVVDRSATDAELMAMDAAGVTGARINAAVDGVGDAGAIEENIRRLDAQLPAAWHIQLHIAPAMLAQLAACITTTQRNFVLDHFGLLDLSETSRATEAAEVSRFLEIFAGGNLYLKLSAPYLLSPDDDDPALHRLITRLVNTRADRLLWGTNWPHTQGTARAAGGDAGQVEPFRLHDDLRWRQLCADGAGPSALQVMGGNAALLYRFGNQDVHQRAL